MNIKQVARVVSVLLFIIAFFMLIPFFMALYSHETEIVQSFLIPIGAIVFISALILFFTRVNKKDTISTRDGFLLVTLSWALSAFFSCLPFVLSKSIPHLADAFFETFRLHNNRSFDFNEY